MKMRSWWKYGITSGLFLVGAATCDLATAQPPEVKPPLVRQNFEDGLGDWSSFGETAKVSLSTQPENVKEGQAALRFDYAVKAGQFNALFAPMPPRVLEKVRLFRFWIKADHASSLAFVLQEQGGGRYLSIFHAPKDIWQQVEILPSDFVLTEEKDGTKDPNNKLDLDLVEGVALGDLSQMFIQNTESAKLLGITAGPRTFYLDDVSVSDAVLPAVEAPEGLVNLDAFTAPQLSWVATGDVRLSRVKDQVLEGPALQADYRQAPGKIAGFSKAPGRGKLAGMEQLQFAAASTKPALLLLQLEEKSGGKYNKMINLGGEKKLNEVKLSFKDFKPGADSKDNNDRLDLDQVKQLLILDMSGFLGLGENDVTLWVGPLRLAPAG